jgi:hypothetical protein
LVISRFFQTFRLLLAQIVAKQIDFTNQLIALLPLPLSVTYRRRPQLANSTPHERSLAVELRPRKIPSNQDAETS